MNTSGLPGIRPRFKADLKGGAATFLRYEALLNTDNASDGPSMYGGRYYLRRPRDPASDMLRRLPLERGASRALVQTNAIAAGAIATNVDRVVGTGLALVASPNRKVLGWSEQQVTDWREQFVHPEFSIWADSPDCDLRAELNFYDQQRLVERTSLESGDAFTLLPDAAKATSWMPYKLRTQIVEADRVGNPKGQADSAEVAGGVKRDPGTGAALGYFFYDRHPGGSYVGAGDPFKGEWRDRRDERSGRVGVLHHFRALRPEQPRGVPYLSPITYLLAQLDRYTEAEILAAVETANLTLLIEAAPGQQAAPAEIFGLNNQQLAAQGDVIGLAPGAVIGLAPGEKPHIVNPLRPNQGYEHFVLSIIKQIGVGLGIPFELLIKLFASSYSASKAAMLDAWMRWRGERTWISRSYCQPVYAALFTEAVLAGRIPAPGFNRDPRLRWAYLQASWFGDSQGSINPKDEVDAFTAAIEARLCTRERAEWELFGTDWTATFDTKESEEKRLKEADLLPIPKAGAPAPPKPGDKPVTASAHDLAFESLAASVATLAAKETPAPVVHVNVEPPSVAIHQGDTTINMPETQVTLEATIEQPDVVISAGAVVVNQAPALDIEALRVARDPETGDMVGFERKPQH